VTNYQALIHHWQALQGLAPDLFLEIVDDETLRRVTAALQELDQEMTASGVHPHPLDEVANGVMHRVMVYEAEHFPIPEVSGAELLAFMIEQRGLSQHELARATGIPQSTISNLIAGKREFTASHARAFAQYFGGNPGAFLS